MRAIVVGCGAVGSRAVRQLASTEEVEEVAVVDRDQARAVSVSDAESEVRALLDLGTEARERGLHIVVGAGFGPGLSCVLVRHGAALFDVVTEIHVAKAGTGGPACA